MDVLLINSNQWVYPLPVMPLGLCSVAAALEQAGHGVRFLDLCFSPDPSAAISRAVEEFSPQAVGVSVRNIDNCGGQDNLFLLKKVRDRVVMPLRRVFPGPLIIGGPAVGINPQDILGYLGADYAIAGDGEHACVELLRRLRALIPLDGLPGLTHRRPDGTQESNPPWRVGRLADLPAVEPQRYLDLRSYRRYCSPLQIQTKRGCALKCAYCTYARIEGAAYRLHDPQRVADDLERLVGQTGIRSVEIIDSTFNLPLDHAKAVLRAIINKGLKLKLSAMGLNPAGVDRELVALMRSAGFREASLGAEAACEETLRGLGKNFGLKEIAEAGRLLRQAGLPISWFLLLGGPGETRQTLARTMDAIARAAGPWDLIIATVGLRIYNGSPLAESLRRRRPGSTSDNFLTPVFHSPPGLPLEEIDRVVRAYARTKYNLLISNTCHSFPTLSIRVIHALAKLLFPGQPYWRLYILARRLSRGKI